MKAIIHIGMHKTGTSSIQASFDRKPPEGFDYFRHTGTNLNGWARMMFEGDAELKQIQNIANKSEAEIAEIRDQAGKSTLETLAKITSTNVIFSAERFTYMQADAVADFHSWIKSNFDDYEVYAYIRDPMSFIRSSFQQRAKSLAKLSNFVPDFPNYQPRFEKFETTFGTDKVHYRMFRPDNLENRNVVVDFAKWIGTDYAQQDTIKENESISLEALAFLVSVTLAEERTKLSQRKLSKLVETLQQHSGRRWKLSEKRVELILDQIGSDIDWMEKRLPAPLDRTDAGDNFEISSTADFVPLALENFATFRDMIFESMPPATRNLREISSSLRLLKQL